MLARQKKRKWNYEQNSLEKWDMMKFFQSRNQVRKLYWIGRKDGMKKLSVASTTFLHLCVKSPESTNQKKKKEKKKK